MTEFPQLVALQMLLDQQAYEPCRKIAESMIDERMASPAYEQPGAKGREHDLELAHLHLALSKCLFGLQDYDGAACKAENASLLARKAGDLMLHTQAVHFAAGCYCQAGNYRTSIQRFTQALEHATGVLRIKAHYNRGHTYERQGAYRYAIPDYEAAIRLAADADDLQLLQSARINLAWVLILEQEFERAEAVLQQLAAEPDAAGDSLLQAQIAHDRLHMAHLQGRDADAFKQVVQALRQLGQAYPHVRARIALTTFSIAAEQGKHEEAFIIGLLAKKLAAKARRPDYDDDANRKLMELEAEAGSDCLAQSLQKAKQLLPGAHGLRKARRTPKEGAV